MNDPLTREQSPPPAARQVRANDGWEGGVRSNAIVASASSLLNGLVNAGILAYAARQGQTGEIAAYSVMTAALTWVAILVMGGSSLLYVSGNEQERRSVRSQRLLIAMPIMTAATVSLAWLYGEQGYSRAALATAGLVMVLNSLAELRFSDLVRQMRFIAASAVTTGTRLLALALLSIGSPLTIALAAGAGAYLLTAEMLVCCGRERTRPMWAGLSAGSARQAFRLNRRLFGHSLADAFTARAGTIALSLVANPHVVGYYGALVSIYQALVAVVFSGLRVPMAVRTRRRHHIGSTVNLGREGELISLAAASVIAAGTVGFAPWITGNLLHLQMPGSALWLQILALALPFATINRAFILSRIGDGDYRAAARAALAIAAVVAVGLTVQATALGPTGTASATAVAEALVAVVLLTMAASRRQRSGGATSAGGAASSSGRRTSRASDLNSTPAR